MARNARHPAPLVSVALPVHCAGPCFEAAAGSVLSQTLRELELILVLNGADPETRRRAQAIADADARVRIVELPRADLAAALNAALGLASCDLVARMDADDLSLPGRLALQHQRMREEPSLVALGCAFERVDAADRPIDVVTPPVDPREVRWRLLLGNVFAHGSMMLRRSPVLDAGGYDERCKRAQDYELWLRLSRQGYSLAALPETLYRYRERATLEAGADWRPSPEQAQVAAEAMAQAWSELPAGDPLEVARILSGAISAARAPGVVEQRFARLLASGPTREALLGLLWARWQAAQPRQAAMEAGRAALLREASRAMKSSGATGLWLWGAGAHTAWILERPALLDLAIRGVIDDRAPGKVVGGFAAEPPTALRPGDHVLLSSDVHEDDMWLSSEPVRARGVRVWRLYAQQPESPTPVREEAA